MMKIAFVSHLDPRNPHLWSGVPYNMAQSLERAGCALSRVGPLSDRGLPLWLGKKIVYRFALGHRYLIDRERRHLTALAAAAGRQLRGLDHECIVSPGSHATAYLNADRPVAFWTDATFAGMLGFYGSFSNLARESVEAGHRAEQAALERCTLAAYTSSWAAKTAVDFYGADPDKILVLPFGANLPDIPTDAEIDRWIGQRLARPGADPAIRLLFLGVEWERKGGPLVHDTLLALRRMGVPARLTVIGCTQPAAVAADAAVTVTGRLRKWIPAEWAALRAHLAAAHFLFMPSRAECQGIVFCEASAFGVPSVSCRVGGIPSVVAHGVNGLLLGDAAGPGDYADMIGECFARPERYAALCLSSRRRFVHELNWDTAAARFTAAVGARLRRSSTDLQKFETEGGPNLLPTVDQERGGWL